jgi:hypothetical protein
MQGHTRAKSFKMVAAIIPHPRDLGGLYQYLLHADQGQIDEP